MLSKHLVRFFPMLAAVVLFVTLAALKRAGLVSSKQVGPFVFFKRNEAAIQAFVDYIKADI